MRAGPGGGGVRRRCFIWSEGKGKERKKKLVEEEEMGWTVIMKDSKGWDSWHIDSGE